MVARGWAVRGGAVLAAAVALCAASPSEAQTYPARPIHMILPHPAGGPADGPARGIAQVLNAALGQPVVVDNKPGATGIVGMEACKRSPPDGYTVCITNTAVISLNPFIHANLPYDPLADFDPVIMIGYVDDALMANRSVPANSVAELFAMARAKPGTISWASFGYGSPGHLYTAWLRQQMNVSFNHVPYKLSVQVITALVAGEVQVATHPIGPSLEHLRAGTIKALAVTGDRHSKYLPDTPSFKEVGIDLNFRTWIGMFVPAGTSPEIVQKLNVETAKVLADPGYQAQVLARQTIEPAGGSVDWFRAFLREDRQRYAELTRIAELKPE
jgi:tripartite-type tricarboxylate transporter receptor subunit TctC